jgi:hypothetical protein
MNPTFVEDLATLKQNLRLTGLDAAKDSAILLDQAIREVHSGFYRRLDASRLATLVALTPVSPPVTTNDHLREIARQTEIIWVKLKLSWTLPMLFKDTSGQAQAVWNEERTFEGDSSFLDKVRAELYTTIQENLEFLDGDETAGEEASWEVEVFLPEEDPPVIGDSLYPREVSES